MLPKPQIQQATILREMLDLVILIGAIYALVNLATVRFVVHGPSMEPTFTQDQFLIVSRVNYLLGDPERGDIVVFHYPNDPDQDYIKRLIAVPGDTVEIREMQVYVNGDMLTEPYINEPCAALNCSDDMWLLEDNEYFVMGDNRNRSSDSRSFGPILGEFIVGEVMVRYWPPADWGIVSQINYPGE